MLDFKQSIEECFCISFPYTILPCINSFYPTFPVDTLHKILTIMYLTISHKEKRQSINCNSKKVK